MQRRFMSSSERFLPENAGAESGRLFIERLNDRSGQNLRSSRLHWSDHPTSATPAVATGHDRAIDSPPGDRLAPSRLVTSASGQRPVPKRGNAAVG